MSQPHDGDDGCQQRWDAYRAKHMISTTCCRCGAELMVWPWDDVIASLCLPCARRELQQEDQAMPAPTAQRVQQRGVHTGLDEMQHWLVFLESNVGFTEQVRRTARDWVRTLVAMGAAVGWVR